MPLFTPPFPRFPSIAWYVQLAVGLYALLLAAVSWHTLIEDYGVRDELAGMLSVGQCLALMLCLYWPMTGWWVSLAAAVPSVVVAHLALGEAVWPTPILIIHVSVLALVAFGVRPRVLAGIWLITLGVGLVLVVTLPGSVDPLSLADMTILSGAVLVASGALRERREAMGRMARAERVSGEEQARRVLLEERARIARELHDVVAHHMTVIAVQAEAAPYRVPEPPAELARSFATIRAGALEALTELHRVLGLLRSGTPEREPSPQPTLDHLPDLVAGVREAGLDVVLETTGSRRPVSPGVGLSAYRIVQEALSNVLRHAPGADVRVEVALGPECLELRVANGPSRATAPPPSGAGQGLLGMRERAAMLGGELAAGPRGDGGYVVHVRLPSHGGEDA